MPKSPNPKSQVLRSRLRESPDLILRKSHPPTRVTQILVEPMGPLNIASKLTDANIERLRIQYRVSGKYQFLAFDWKGQVVYPLREQIMVYEELLRSSLQFALHFFCNIFDHYRIMLAQLACNFVRILCSFVVLRSILYIDLRVSFPVLFLF